MKAESAARAAGSYKHLFNETAYFLQLAEFLPNLDDGDDLRINTESSLVAPLSNVIALKLSYAIKFDNLPEPDVLAEEIIENLEAGLDSFRQVLAGLGKVS